MDDYDDVIIRTGCKECGRLIDFDLIINEKREFPGFNKDHPQICKSCLNKYYSPQSIRNAKLEKLLKNWWEFWL